MHAGSFSVNRRWRAQNGTGAAAFGGVGREISKIHIPIAHISACDIQTIDFVQNNSIGFQYFFTKFSESNSNVELNFDLKFWSGILS